MPFNALSRFSSSLKPPPRGGRKATGGEHARKKEEDAFWETYSPLAAEDVSAYEIPVLVRRRGKVEAKGPLV